MKWRAIFICLLILASGCSTGLPPADWCYEFDFTSSDYGFTLTTGVWTSGVGFSTDKGRFRATYTNGSPVTATGAILHVRRLEDLPLPIHILASANIFNLTTGETPNSLWESDVPPTVQSADLVLDSRSGTAANTDLFMAAEVRAGVGLVLSTLQVRGNGSNPFPSSNCSAAQYQPATPTPVFGIDLHEDQISDILQQADSQLQSVDTDLTAPDGSPLLPANNMTFTFAYAKWLISPVGAEEITGPFAPIIIGLGLLLIADVALYAVYGTVFVATYLIRWILWVYNQILRLIQAMADITVGSLALIILLAIFGIVAVIWAISQAIK